MDSDERGMLYDLVHTLVLRLNDQRQRAEDAERQLAAAEQRLRVLDAVHYGLV